MSTVACEEKSSVGQRLREERERLSLSQADLGVILDVDRKVVRHYEENKTSPRADQLNRFREHGADVIYILTSERSPLAVNEGRAPYTPAEHLARRLGGMVIDEATAKALQIIIEQFITLDPLLRARAQGYLDALFDQSAVIEGTEGMISLYDFSADGEQGGSEKQGT